MKKSLLLGILVFSLLGISLVSAQNIDYGYGMMGMMYGNYGYGFMLFSWLIVLLVIIALILLIIWLIKQISK